MTYPKDSMGSKEPYSKSQIVVLCESYYEEDTYVNVIGLGESNKSNVSGLGNSFSLGDVNEAYSDLADVNISPVSPKNRFTDLEVVAIAKQQKVQRSMLMVLGVLMLIILVILVVFIAITYPQYLSVSEAVTDLQHNVSTFQKHAMEEQDNLKMKVAHLSDEMDNICTVCPAGWHTIGSTCYYLSEELRSWDEARHECYKVNSFLVMIKDKNESDSLNALFISNRKYWIGLRRDAKEIHIWRWLDGSDVTFTNWAVNEPNFYASREHCAENLSGPWNDANCAEKRNYICEKNRFC